MRDGFQTCNGLWLDRYHLEEWVWTVSSSLLATQLTLNSTSHLYSIKTNNNITIKIDASKIHTYIQMCVCVSVCGVGIYIYKERELAEITFTFRRR